MSKVYASMLNADMSKIGQELEKVIKSGIEGLHFDFINSSTYSNQSHFTPSYVAKVVQAVRKYRPGYETIEAHIISSDPDKLITEYKDAGVSRIMLQYDSFTNKTDLLGLLRRIRQESPKLKAGVSFATPSSAKSVDFNTITSSDYFIILGSSPGADLTPLMPSTYGALLHLMTMKRKFNPSLELGIEGGVTVENSKKLKGSGSEILILGKAFFMSRDYEAFVKSIK